MPPPLQNSNEIIVPWNLPRLINLVKGDCAIPYFYRETQVPAVIYYACCSSAPSLCMVVGSRVQHRVPYSSYFYNFVTAHPHSNSTTSHPSSYRLNEASARPNKRRCHLGYAQRPCIHLPCQLPRSLYFCTV